MKRTYLMMAVLLVSVGLNVALAYKLRQFGYFEQVKADARADRLLKPGTQLPQFQATDLNGQRQNVAVNREGDRPTVLYVFTPPCHWCARNMDNLKELVARKGDEFRFIGISLGKDGLSDYVVKNDLTMPIYTDLSDQTKKAFKMGATPQTIVVSPEGKVIQSWTGAYTGDQQKQVEEYFGITLPGLKAENK